MADRDDMIEKVRKLWAKADGTDNEDERATFLAAARNLMSKYQIDEMVLQEKTHNRDAVVLADILIYPEGRTEPAVPDQRITLAHYIGVRNRCRCVIRSLPPSVARDGSPIKGGMYLTVCGFKSDVDTVRSMYELLCLDMLEQMHLEPTDHMAPRAKKNYWQNFCDGYAMRVDQRLFSIGRDVEKGMAEAGGSMALVLRDRSTAVDDQFAQMFPNLRTQKVVRYTRDDNARQRGRDAADRADMGQEKMGKGSQGQVGGSQKELT